MPDIFPASCQVASSSVSLWHVPLRADPLSYWRMNLQGTLIRVVERL